ncbi:hypothetical protein COOONC_12847 [Cooperia oncophora]
MSIGIGLVACGVSSVFFGTMFVPVRKYDAGDGMFTQWVISTAILMVGFGVFCLQEFPGFYPLAMLGGAFWAIGNEQFFKRYQKKVQAPKKSLLDFELLLRPIGQGTYHSFGFIPQGTPQAIPIISRLGMTVGILIWNTTNCLTGWAGGRFGLFGMKAHPPASSILNYAGLVFVIIGGILFSRVKSETGTSEKEAVTLSYTRRTSKDDVNGVETARLTHEETPPEVEFSGGEKCVTRSSHNGKQRIIGIAMALVAGVFYGMTFVPVIYMMDNPEKFPNYPDDGLTYVFSHYFGIFLTSTVMFVAYAMVKLVFRCLRFTFKYSAYLFNCV